VPGVDAKSVPLSLECVSIGAGFEPVAATIVLYRTVLSTLLVRITFG